MKGINCRIELKKKKEQVAYTTCSLLALLVKSYLSEYYGAAENSRVPAWSNRPP